VAQLYKIDTRELVDAAASYKAAGGQLVRALTATVNFVGDRALTQSTRTLAKQMGLPIGKTKQSLQVYRATFERIEYDIVGRGFRLSLRSFGASQRNAGVSARPWGVRRIFRGSFIVQSLDGQVFKRGPGPLVRYTTTVDGKERTRMGQPLVKLWGPGIPTEMMRDQVPVIFQQTVKERFAPRLEHEIAQALAKLGKR
jgi:hypothetical protein